MIVGHESNKNQLIAFLPSMKARMAEWQIISVKISEKNTSCEHKIFNTLLQVYKDTEGIIFKLGDNKIMMVVRLGDVRNYNELKFGIEAKLPKYGARVIARKMNASGLRQVQLDFRDIKLKTHLSLYRDRAKREENVFLVAEDDEFVSKIISGFLEEYGTVHIVDDGMSVLDEYKRLNPDLILLDIHLPNKTGLELVDELMDLDTDAFILMVSADTVKDNVLEAVKTGAVGFLAKPIRKEKMIEYVEQCTTLKIPDADIS